MSREKLASLVGVSLDTVGRWERGNRIPKADDLANLAAALNTTVGALMDGFANSSDSENSIERASVEKLDQPAHSTKSAEDLDEIIKEMAATNPEVIIRFRNMRLKWHELSDMQKRDVVEGMNYVLGRIPDDGTIFKKVGKKGRI